MVFCAGISIFGAAVTQYGINAQKVPKNANFLVAADVENDVDDDTDSIVQ
jgi:hypothetical protein